MDDASKFDIDAGWEKSGKIWLPTKFFPLSCLDEARTFEFREWDILITSYPKTGIVIYYFLQRSKVMVTNIQKCTFS